ncbi:hypothetical protein HDU83_005118 [Entophlyctis luteolus]|nr:hypothetical protein HDU83_005118 [Entophlyctis luteolus]KAJ3381272.1 hypothetical protein HDU84_005237 [Entophlyctis sp. JEL0112]
MTQTVLVFTIFKKFGLLKPTIETTMCNFIFLCIVAARFAFWGSHPTTSRINLVDPLVQEQAARIPSHPQTLGNFSATLSRIASANVSPGVTLHVAAFACMLTIQSLAIGLQQNITTVCWVFGCISPRQRALVVEALDSRSLRVSWNARKPALATASSNQAQHSLSRLNASAASARAAASSATANDASTAVASAAEDTVYAPARSFELEINGAIVGSTKKPETCVDIKGLPVNTALRLRVWAVAARNIRTGSGVLVVRTPLGRPAIGGDDPKKQLASVSVSVQTATISPDSTTDIVDTEADGNDSDPENAGAATHGISTAFCSSHDASTVDPSSNITGAYDSGRDNDAHEEDPRAAAEVARLTAAISNIRHLQNELDKITETTRADHASRVSAMEDELAKLKAERKVAEPARLAMKAELKGLEEIKRTSDARREKIEHALNAAKAEMEHMRQEVLNCDKEIEEIKADIKRTETRAKQEEEALERKRRDLDESIAKLKSELEALDVLRTNAKSAEESMLNYIRIKEAVIEGIENETILIGQIDNKLSDFDEDNKAVTENLKIWNEIHEKLISEHQRFKAELREERRVKEVLLQELARAKMRLSHSIGLSSDSRSSALHAPRQKIRLLQPAADSNSFLFSAQADSSDQAYTPRYSVIGSTLSVEKPATTIMSEHKNSNSSSNNKSNSNGPGMVSSPTPATTVRPRTEETRTPDEDALERAVAHSLMGEINAHTIV